LGISACSSILKLPPELLEIHAVLCRFPLANKDHRNIPTVALLEDRIGIYIDLPEYSAKFSQERRDGGLGFVAEVASWTRIESDVAGTASGKACVFRMSAHRLSAKAHLTGEQARLGRSGA
jgi:hypothetical protein